ncbi:hypothetical protein M1555_00555 [Patescibacteria group bacterium]|nr:hypothetical protein [Patescibacteria group bacterium]
MKRPPFTKNGILSLALLTLCSFAILWPLLRHGFFVSDDGEWMIIRLTAFFQSLREGQFPVRFLGRLNNSYGYPVANFLYPGFLYLGSLIHILGFSFVDAVKLILGGSVIGSVWYIYLWLRKSWDETSAFAGSLGFLLAPYLGFDLYKRGSVGEILALLPASAALYALSSGNQLLLALAVGFLIVSHNTLALLLFPLIVVWIVLKRQFRYFLPVAAGIGLSAFFWMPALFERGYVMFGSIILSKPEQFIVDGTSLYLLNFGAILACILLLTGHRVKERMLTVWYVSLFVAVVFIATPLGAPLWHSAVLTRYVQFPYRFLAVGLFAGAWIVAASLSGRPTPARIALTACYVLLWAGPVWTIMSRVVPVDRTIGYYTTNEATTTVADEYMPVWASARPATRAYRRIEFYTGQGSIVLRTGTTERIDAVIHADENSVIQINSLYYPGWGATLDDVPVELRYDNPEGLMRFSVPEGTHHIFVEFRETIFRFTADVISLVSFIVLGIVAAGSVFWRRAW